MTTSGCEKGWCDAGFASFKVLVTNADGTTTVETLAQAGVTAINLVPNDTFVQQIDGSAVTGQTTFTKSDGATGTAADVTLAYDANGYIIKSTITHNGDGSTTIDKKAYGRTSASRRRSAGRTARRQPRCAVRKKTCLHRSRQVRVRINYTARKQN